MAHIESILNQFLEQKTSKVRGYKEYIENVLEGAKQRYDFNALSITEDEYLEIWEYLPDNEADRIFGSDDDVLIVSEVLQKQKSGESANNYSVKEIMEIMHNRNATLKETLGNLGLSTSDYMRSLGKLE